MMPSRGENSAGSRFPSIFSPRRIGSFTSPNAVKYAACSVSNFNNADGTISEREFARMRVVCDTGAGMITNQGAYPDPEAMGKGYFRQISIADDTYIPDLQRIATMIHDAGALAIQQILHAGRYGGIHADHCLQPSEVAQTLPHFRPPRRMTVTQIQGCIDDHVDAALRAIQAGFDGIEITAFMGYLLATFLSPFTNDRNDHYGGNLTNRGRFMVELIEAIRSAIGRHLFWIRLNATELMDDRGGSSDDDCLEYMKMAQAAGVDGISIVIGWHESTRGALGRDLPSDQWLYLAERAKKQLDIPLAFGPRFGDPVLAEKALADGVIDFWEVCRPFLADPLLLMKVKEDRIHQIRPCVGGLMCLSRMFRNLPYVCTMNPQLGHEYEPEYQITATKYRKIVQVYGGGPAGLEAAVTAARRGHHVTLYERSDRLGGQLNASSVEIAGGNVYKRVVEYYEGELEKYKVDVRLNTPVDWRMVAKHRPDVGIVATGARIKAPELPGIQQVDVLCADQFTMNDRLQGKRVVVLGGGRAGLVVGEYLAQLGNTVAIVDQGERLAFDVIPTFKWRHISWVKELEIDVMRNVRAIAVSEQTLRLRNDAGEEHTLPFDLLVIAGPRRSHNNLSQDLIFSCDELYTIGDAVRPRNVCDAIHEGYKIGVRV